MYDKSKHSNLPYNLKCNHLQKDLQIIQKKLQAYIKFKKFINVEFFLNFLPKNNKVVIK
jgi:hypothetical protein